MTVHRNKFLYNTN